PIHEILRTGGPDTRLKDVEIVLRFMSVVLFGELYHGSVKEFLDNAMKLVNADWSTFKPTIEKTYKEFNRAVSNLKAVFGPHVGRKFVAGKWEGRFNRVLFEVEAYYFKSLTLESCTA